MNTSIFIRPACESDAPVISLMLSDHGLPVAGLLAHLPGFLVAVDQAGDSVIGCIGCEEHGDAVLLRSAVVREGWRGRGVGAGLVARLLARFSAAGRRHVYLRTTSAAAYFHQWGFEAISACEVPDSVKASSQFQGACPASAETLRCVLPANTMVS